MNPVEFGFLANATTITWQAGANTIAPLAKHADVVAAMQREIYVHDGWFYPPLRSVKSGVNAPLIPTGFALPATHQLHLSDTTADDEEANFMIALFGLLKGQRLQRPEWQHFYKAPVASKLNDFCATPAEISKTLDIATGFWRQHTPEVQKLAFGALHWHLFAQLYEQPFERFNAQYMALDACAKLALKIGLPGYSKHPTHSKRAAVLCNCLDVPKPVWVLPLDGQTECELARCRNELVHEAMYAGQPMGFANPKGHHQMVRELTGLVARIFLRLLGVQNVYTQSVCDECGMNSFGLPA